MSTKPQLFVTADVAELLGTTREELSQIFLELEVHELGFKAIDAPSVLQLVAAVLTWSTVFKAGATVFLSRLAQNAADDVWKHKAELAAKLAQVVTQPLHLLASSIARLKLQIPRSCVAVGLPIPDDYWATILTIESAEEVEVAWLLANFILRAEEIERTVSTLLEAGHIALGCFNLHLSSSGQWVVKWQDEAGVDQECLVR